jgi:hypothetical protein
VVAEAAAEGSPVAAANSEEARPCRRYGPSAVVAGPTVAVAAATGGSREPP